MAAVYLSFGTSFSFSLFFLERKKQNKESAKQKDGGKNMSFSLVEKPTGKITKSRAKRHQVGFCYLFPWAFPFPASLFHLSFSFSFGKKKVKEKREAGKAQLQATNHFFQPKFISFSFLKRNVGWKEGLWAS